MIENMRNRKFKCEKGAISLFVMAAMLFFLVSVVGVYAISSKRAQTQTEALDVVQDKYYMEGEESTKYDSKIMSSSAKIPIYTKEQFWSIGEDCSIEIEGKVYDFSNTNYANYELQNDIVINVETDLKASKFKDDLYYGEDTISKNGHQILYYYDGEYYLPVAYSDGTKTYSLGEGTAKLSASGTDFATISTTTTGLTGEYYLFGVKIVTAASLTTSEYGAKVSNYSCENSEACGWRIFHTDGDNIYLIADENIKISYMPGTVTPGSDGDEYGISIVGLDGEDIHFSHVAYKWLKKFIDTNRSYYYDNTSNALNTLEYLLDTEKWSSFKGEDASYAIGSPTLEMFIASYNATHTDANLEVEVTGNLGYTFVSDDYTGKYVQTIDVSDDLYVTDKALMLASTSEYGNDYMILQTPADGYLGNYGDYNTKGGLRPVVCLNSEVKLMEQPDGSFKIIK